MIEEMVPLAESDVATRVRNSGRVQPSDARPYPAPKLMIVSLDRPGPPLRRVAVLRRMVRPVVAATPIATRTSPMLSPTNGIACATAFAPRVMGRPMMLNTPRNPVVTSTPTWSPCPILVVAVGSRCSSVLA